MKRWGLLIGALLVLGLLVLVAWRTTAGGSPDAQTPSGTYEPEAQSTLIPEQSPEFAALPEGARPLASTSRGEELLAIDKDGAALVSFHENGIPTPGTGNRTGSTVWLGEEPGVALIAPDGSRSVLVNPWVVAKSRESGVWAELRGEMAVVRITSILLDTAGEGIPAGTFYYGSRHGRLEEVPSLTAGGAQVDDVMELTYGAVHVADDFIIVAGRYQGVFSVDPATGQVSPLDFNEEPMPVTYRDLCAPDGTDVIGYLAGNVEDRKQWSATWSGDAPMRVLELDPVGASPYPVGIFATSCGDLVANEISQSEPRTLVWRDADGEHTVALPTSAAVIQIFAVPGYLAVSTVGLGGVPPAVYVVRLADRAISPPIATCGNLFAAVDLLAIGVGEYGDCDFYVTSIEDLFPAG